MAPNAAAGAVQDRLVSFKESAVTAPVCFSRVVAMVL